jgi:hypothetical protein
MNRLSVDLEPVKEALAEIDRKQKKAEDWKHLGYSFLLADATLGVIGIFHEQVRTHYQDFIEKLQLPIDLANGKTYVENPNAQIAAIAGIGVFAAISALASRKLTQGIAFASKKAYRIAYASTTATQLLSGLYVPATFLTGVYPEYLPPTTGALGFIASTLVLKAINDMQYNTETTELEN